MMTSSSSPVHDLRDASVTSRVEGTLFNTGKVWVANLVELAVSKGGVE